MSKNFNIQETVHRNIEKNQFPNFANHRSLIGWCSMNYPKVLVNPIYMTKQPQPQNKKFELETMFQQKNPTDRTKNQFVRPFSNYTGQKNQAFKMESSISPDKIEKGASYKGNPKLSSMSLATTKYQIKQKIFEENNKISEEYSAIRPLGNVLGANKDGNFDRKVRQIGEVYYNPPNEGEMMRHLKKMPNTVINEHNLLDVMDDRLQYLDLQYKNDISNDLINKIGYLAPNIKELVLTAVPITNEVLIELGISCKFLEAIDISLCKNLEEFSIIRFLKNNSNLRKFSANHLENSFTDECLQMLGNSQNLEELSINFCTEITSAGIQHISKNQFTRLGLANLPNLKTDDFSRLFVRSVDSLSYLDISFNPTKQVSKDLMVKIGMCTNIETLILTGCEMVSDDGMNNLIYGDKVKGKANEGFMKLNCLKIGGLKNVSDNLYQLLKRCPMLSFVQANNLERLSDHFMDQTKSLPHIKTLLINFTPNITDEKIKQIRETNKGMNIIRNIVKMTDPTDDGLRMPIPPASLKIKKPKKKKK